MEFDFKKQIEESEGHLADAKAKTAEIFAIAQAEERDFSEDEDATIAAMETQAAAATKRISALRTAEKTMGLKAVQKQAPAVIKKRDNSKAREKGDIIFKMATVSLVAHETKQHQLQVAEKMYGHDDDFMTVIKAPVNPAATDVAGWAAELVDDALQGFLDILRAESVGWELLGMAGISLNFDRLGAIKVPTREGTSTDMRSGWTGERDAIPVRRATTGSITIYPYKWGVISTFSKELDMRSTPQIESLVRQFIIQDTAEQLDFDLFGVGPLVTGLNPAGLMNGITGTAASSATDLVTRINDDLKALKKALIDENCYGMPYIYMSESNALEIEYALSSDGTTYPFRDEIAAGRLGNTPFRTSNNIPNDQLLIVDVSQIAAAVGAPTFTTSDTATLVEINDEGPTATDNPAMEDAYPRTDLSGQVGDQATWNSDPLNTTKGPIRSLFQTETVAVKNVQYLSWHRMRSECVNRITGVDYPA